VIDSFKTVIHSVLTCPRLLRDAFTPGPGRPDQDDRTLPAGGHGVTAPVVHLAPG